MGNKTMGGASRILKPALWTFYLVIVCEILFMISPFALHFYSAYGPALNFLHRWPATAWLAQFFLPHFSMTRSPVLNALREAGAAPLFAGTLLFLSAAVPVYWAKLWRRGPVTGGLYAYVRHPQYLALAVVGLGALLLWPRFLVLITYVTMLFLYSLLAHWEEQQCLARFGESYRAYQARTGMFLPRRLSEKVPPILPASGAPRALAMAGAYAALLAAAVALGFVLRDYSLSQVTASYAEDVAVLSPALLSETELAAAYGAAAADPKVQQALHAAGDAKLIVYVVPQEWYLPDLPLEKVYQRGGHQVPANFNRRQYKLLFTRARTHQAASAGRGIVKAAYGREPLLLVNVDLSVPQVIRIGKPPPHVYWGDIPTPMF